MSPSQDTSVSFFSPSAASSTSIPLTPNAPLPPYSTDNNNNDPYHPQNHPTNNHNTATTMELQVNWDPMGIQMELLKATTLLSHRGLKFAAKWTAEQLVGLPSTSTSYLTFPPSYAHHQHYHHEEKEEDNDDDFDETQRRRQSHSFFPTSVKGTTTTTTASRMKTTATSHVRPPYALDMEDTDFFMLTPKEWYAKTLLDLGEYLHAAHVLSETTMTTIPSRRNPPARMAMTTSSSQDVLMMPPPAHDLTSFGIYLRAYSLYMAGERRKEEEHLELQSETQKHKTCRNPYLLQLMEELEDAYTGNSRSNRNTNTTTPTNGTPTAGLDAFGLYVYGMVLKEAQKETLTCRRPAYILLVESILEFPYNWSAWLDLAEILSLDSMLEPIVEQALQPTLATNFMYHFFCAHLMSHHHQAYEDALVLYERLYEPIPDQPPLFDSSYLKSQLGVVHYHLRDFEPALEWFHQIKDPYLLDQKDIYSNILYVREDRVGLSQLAHQAIRIDKYRPETCCIIGNYYSLKQKRQKAVQYFQRALQLDRHYTSAWTLMGHEYVELKQTESAMEAYRRAVNVSPKDYRAWYGLGQTYEFLNMHLYALFYYRKAARLRPYDARMWCAVGLALCALHKIPDAIRAYERAVAQEDTEGIATQKLASLYRQEGRTEEAAQCYIRHLELRYMVTAPTTASTTSVMNNDPTSSSSPATLDAIVQGVVVEAPEAEALVFLAHYYKSHGEYDTSALMCSRLVEYPGPEKEQAKGLLRDLRSRGRGFHASSTTTNNMTTTSTTTTTTRNPVSSTTTTANHRSSHNQEEDVSGMLGSPHPFIAAGSPAYSPTSPVYSPTSPAYSPPSSEYSP